MLKDISIFCLLYCDLFPKNKVGDEYPSLYTFPNVFFAIFHTSWILMFIYCRYKANTAHGQKIFFVFTIYEKIQMQILGFNDVQENW